MNSLQILPFLFASFVILSQLFSRQGSLLNKHRLIFVPKRVENFPKRSISKNK